MDSQEFKIEVVRLNKLDGDGKTKAFCDISLSDTFIVKGLRIVEGKNGIFVSMPREPGKDGKWYMTFIPLKKEIREELDRIVLEAYEA
ncbi:septation protein SpoVG family protein [Candidatus Omnitrophota bacterium]